LSRWLFRVAASPLAWGEAVFVFRTGRGGFASFVGRWEYQTVYSPKTITEIAKLQNSRRLRFHRSHVAALEASPLSCCGFAACLGGGGVCISYRAGRFRFFRGAVGTTNRLPPRAITETAKHTKQPKTGAKLQNSRRLGYTKPFTHPKQLQKRLTHPKQLQKWQNYKTVEDCGEAYETVEDCCQGGVVCSIMFE